MPMTTNGMPAASRARVIGSPLLHTAKQDRHIGPRDAPLAPVVFARVLDSKTAKGLNGLGDVGWLLHLELTKESATMSPGS